MTMKKGLLFFMFLQLIVFVNAVSAQETSAGKSYSINYNLWNSGGAPETKINCGNDTLFNTGNYLTLEVWARPYWTEENRKIMGKIASDGSVFNNGYVMGFGTKDMYTEIWNPDYHSVAMSNPGPLPEDSAWMHLAITYACNGKIRNYLNGNIIGDADVFPQNPIAPGDSSFIIGEAPWGYSFVYYGDLDEVRVWNVERTQEELQEYMFRELKGDEPGLVAYYTFNDASEGNVPDKTANSLNGVMSNWDGNWFEWATSYAPVGDSLMYNMTDIQASWYGRGDQYTSINTTNGLTMVTTIPEKNFKKYVVIGHDDLTGVSEEDLPEGASAGYKRLNRAWYVNRGGEVSAQPLAFNLQDAAGGGEELPGDGADSLYTLLVRSEEMGKFTAVTRADNTQMDQYIIFNSVLLKDGFYTLGYGSCPLFVDEYQTSAKKIKVFPNPAKDIINIVNADNSDIYIYNITGQQVYSQIPSGNEEVVDLSGLSDGLYLIKILNKKSVYNSMFIIRK